MDKPMYIDTDKFNLLEERRRHLEQENDALKAERAKFLGMLNRLQGLGQSALGNISRITKDMQEYLRDALAEEGAEPEKT